jgi:xanthine dehydrogenase accessory factor
MNIKDIFTALLEKTGAGEDAVLATIVAEAGSGPRSAGARMLVDAKGRVCGTIGGGTLEYRAVQYAQALLEKQQSERKIYRLHPNDEEELGMLCGGDLEIYFQFIRGGDEKTIALCGECLDRLEKDADLWLFTDLSDPNNWVMALYGADTAPVGMKLGAEDIRALARNKGVMAQITDSESGQKRRVYGEQINFAGKVFIFGGGHCAQALAPVLGSTGFRCVIFDNREEYVSRELFPSVYDLITGDYEQIEKKISVTCNDYIVIVTHAWDLAVLRQVISKNCAYIGVIGSRTKAAALKERLKDEGVSEERLNRINAPIGLRIRSETPEEIAVSIAAEMILRRAEQRDAAWGPEKSG